MLSEKERKDFHALLAPYLDDPDVQSMKRYIQHGCVTTFDHSYRVAERCYEYALRHGGYDLGVTVRAAFLHDFYLYDWHEKDKSHALHGYHHAERAMRNAAAHFGIGEREQRAIYSHMWPLNLTRVPTSKEAWLLTTVDKIVSLEETFHRKGVKPPVAEDVKEKIREANRLN